MEETEEVTIDNGGKKKKKKETVNGKPVKTAPDGTKYAEKNGKKIAVTAPQKSSLVEGKKTVETEKPKSGPKPGDTINDRPIAEYQKDPDREEFRYYMKTPGGGKRPAYRDKRGYEYVKDETGKKLFTSINSGRPAMNNEPAKPQQEIKGAGGTINGRPIEEYKNDPDREEFSNYMKTPGGGTRPAYRDKRGYEYVKDPQTGKKLFTSMSRDNIQR